MRRRPVHRDVVPPVDGGPLHVEDVTGASRPGPDDPQRDARWRELRGVMFRAECGHPRFDPRAVLRLQGGRLEAWVARRDQWLESEVFK